MIQSDYYRQVAQNYYVSGAKKVALMRSFSTLVALLLAMLDFSPAPGSQITTRPSAQDAKIAELVKQLGSDEASSRQAAMNALVAIGLPARPAILKAIGSDDPGLRDEAEQILLQLPWSLPEDPGPVRDVLSHYGTPDIAIRREAIDNLARLDGDAGLAALLRLLNEDPSTAVRWTIVSRLRGLDQGPQLAHLRTVQPPQNDPPMLALCGYARLAVDPSGARRFLQRCADLEFAAPSDDDSEFDFVVTTLAELACRQKQFNAAAQLRRRQYARGSQTDEADISIALLELFALHGQYGPLPGLADDLKLAGAAVDSAKIQYALSRAYANAGDADRAKDARAHAFAASTLRRQRYYVGQFLYQHGWNDAAENEFTQFLKMQPDPDNVEPDISGALAHILLGELAAQRGDDLAAAQHQEAALLSLGDKIDLSSTDSDGHRRPILARDIHAQIDWHYLRAASANHDQAQVSRRLAELIVLKPTDPDIVIELVPLLRQRGRLSEAAALFDGAFYVIKSRLDADPSDPSLLNDAAWLCAGCDQKLDDALNWASQAVAAMPQDAAIIDTLAEVNFRLGRAAEAVRLESAAISLEPQDQFMAGQLKRFRAAADSRPSSN
jgi:tetratricopeptide (TPR) repeat protein